MGILREIVARCKGDKGSPWACARELRAVAAFAAQHCAELSMGLRPRLSAAAASRLVWNPRAEARGSNILSRGNMDRQDEKLLHAKLTRSIIACAFEVINELGSGFLESEARQGPLSGEAVWRQTILFILSIHVNQGSTHARRRNQTPHRGFRHSGSLQFGVAELRAVAAYAAQHCADLSMGLRPRLSAAAASRLAWSPRAGARESNIHSRGNMDRQDEKLLFSLRCPSRSAFGRSRLATNL